jgi:hypothetical protein
LGTAEDLPTEMRKLIIGPAGGCTTAAGFASDNHTIAAAELRDRA